MINKLKAITLTETVVYIAIFSIFMLTLMQFFISIQINQDKVYKELELEMNRIFVTNHFEEKIKNKFILDQQNSLIDEEIAEIVFLSENKTLSYKIITGNLILDNTNEIISITNNKAVVETFQVEPIINRTDNLSAIKISIKFVHRDNANISYDFNTLVNLISDED
jgi:hypothetical protein